MFRGSPILGNFTIVYIVMKLQYPFNSAFRVSKQCHIIYDHILYVYVYYIYNYAHTILQSQYKTYHTYTVHTCTYLFLFVCLSDKVYVVFCRIQNSLFNRTNRRKSFNSRGHELHKIHSTRTVFQASVKKKTKSMIHVNVWAIM